MELFLLQSPQSGGSSIDLNININDLINELRTIYDDLKYQKSEVNKKIRTLNNAHSRKNRKLNEYDNYTQKAENIKSNMIQSARDSYTDITNQSAWIEGSFSSDRKRIETIISKANILSSRGELTMSQEGAIDLFNQFSSEVLQYIDANFSQLKNWKYDDLEAFLKEELEKEGESFINEGTLSTKLTSSIGIPYSNMLSLAGEFKQLKLQEKQKREENDYFLAEKLRIINFKESERQIIENLRSVAQNQLMDATVTLQNAISEGALQEVIEELTKDKADVQEKLDQLIESYQDLTDDLTLLIDEKNDIESKINQWSTYYSSLFSQMSSQITDIFSKFNNDRGELMSDYDSYYRTTGRIMDGDVRNIMLTNTSNIGQFDLDALKDFDVSKLQERNSFTWGRKDYSPAFTLQNSTLRNVVPGFNDQLFTSNQTWLNKNSFTLDYNFYNELKKYLEDLSDIALEKGAIQKLQDMLSDYQYEMNQMYELKQSKISFFDSLNTQILDLKEQEDLLNTQFIGLQDQLNGLDSNDPDFLNQWISIKESMDYKASQAADLNNEWHHVLEQVSSLNVYIDGVLNPRITDLELAISNIDDEVRQRSSSIRQIEADCKIKMNELFDPEFGQILINMGLEGVGFYSEGYSTALSETPFTYEFKSKLRIKITKDWEAFMDSKFGYLTAILVNPTNPESAFVGQYDQILDKASQFIAFFY